MSAHACGVLRIHCAEAGAHNLNEVLGGFSHTAPSHLVEQDARIEGEVMAHEPATLLIYDLEQVRRKLGQHVVERGAFALR